nr:hypothetical protein [uncultured archaeon]
MKEIIFDIDDNYLLLHSGILMFRGECPYCGEGHGDSFVPERLEKDKTEYICKCEDCGEKAKVVIPPRLGTPRETINKVVDHLEKNRLKLEAELSGGENQAILEEF